jgi:ribose 5-phosphate isomerase RpiB
MRMGIASDRGGSVVKHQIESSLVQASYEVVNFGAHRAFYFLEHLLISMQIEDQVCTW